MILSKFKAMVFGLAFFASTSLAFGTAHAQSASVIKSWQSNIGTLLREDEKCQKGIAEGRRQITLARNSGYENDYIMGTAAGLTICALRVGDYETVLEFGPTMEEAEELRPIAVLSQIIAATSLERAEAAYSAVLKLNREYPADAVETFAVDSTWWDLLRLVKTLPNPEDKALKIHEIISWFDYKGFDLIEAEDLKARYLELAILANADLGLVSRLMEGLASPATAMQILVDKRFDAVRNLPGFARLQDVMAVTQARYDISQRQIAANPNKLQPYVNLAMIERWMKRPDAAIATLDKAIAMAKKSPKSFEDYESTLPWLYSEKSRALSSKGLSTESLAAIIEAARLRKPEDHNPSQTINLGLHYVQIGRYQDALNTFDLLPDGLNDFAKALVVSARGCSSFRLNGNEADLAKTRTSLVELGEDGQRNLVPFEACIGNLDGLEEAYLALLRNPDTRSEALMHAQALRQPSVDIGSEAMKWDDYHREVLKRPKVAAAIAELGNPLDVPLETRDFTY